jgi:hypothetical protein
MDADALLDLAARAAPDRVICVATLHRDSDYLCLLPLNKRVGRCERVPLLGRIPVLLILSKAMVTKNNFYTLWTGRLNSPVDRQRLAEVHVARVWFILFQVAPSDALERACLFEQRADVAGDAESCLVICTSIGVSGGTCQEFTQVVERLCLTVPVTEIAVQLQCLIESSRCGQVVPG